ncbi:TPA: hypothetical protein JG871_003924 [Enterobacter hormaechei subsp. xiangfangensis]|nr:hypothetical protein [Enterobacter hormaechei subsp. xiangfangensis]
MKRSAAIEIIDLARLAGLDQEATARILNDRILVKTYWQQPENRIRQSNFDRQRAMPKLVQSLYANGIKSTVIARFTRLSDRQVMQLIAREL